MKKLMLALLFPLACEAVTVTDVGTLPPPNEQPRCSTLNGSVSYSCNAQWSMSSSCSDINELGIAACTSKATAPDYRCSINRFAPKCKNIKFYPARYDGILSQASSYQGITGNINSAGDISSTAGLLRADGTYTLPLTSVIWVNDGGDYIAETAAATGGGWYTVYTDTIHSSDGSIIPFAGLTSPYGGLDGSMPTVIGNDGTIAGLQLLERAGSGGHVEHYTAGTGRFLSQADIDVLPRDQDGWLMPWQALWPFRAVTPYISAGNALYINDRSYVFDINDNGDLIIGIQGQRYFFESSQVCAHADSCFTPSFSPSGINNYGIFVGGGHYVGIQGLMLDLNVDFPEIAAAGYSVVAVSDINDAMQVAGTCLKAGRQTGCIIGL
jgi:hypothetical protein